MDDEHAAHPHDDLDHGPGWVTDPETLRPRLTEPDVFRQDRRADPMAGILERLWSGEAVGAEHLLAQVPQDFRARLLMAESWSRQGRHQEAVAALRTLLVDNRVAPREPLLRHHLGCALLAAGEAAEAASQFSRAMAQLSSVADPALLGGSARGLELARRGMEG